MNLPRYDPMLATRHPRAFSDPNWLFEPKWDGMRLLLAWDGASISLRTRSGREAADQFPELRVEFDRPTILDGELVALDDRGAPSFERLQPRMTGHRADLPIVFMVFDLLFDDHPIIERPLEERLGRLAEIAFEPPLVRSQVVQGEGEALFAAIRVQGLEGIVAKRLGSAYRPGVRSPNWRKVTVRRTIRAVVGGFTPGEGERAATFGSLLLGLWSASGLRWIGAVGTGFGATALTQIRAALDEMRIEACPFESDSELPVGAVWVAPSLVAVVEYKEWTSAGRLRGPSFKGFGAEPVDRMTWEVEGPDAVDS